MARGLLDLPVEVLLAIISCLSGNFSRQLIMPLKNPLSFPLNITPFLSPHLSEKDLVQLLQTCRYLNAISRSGGIWRALAISHYGPHFYSLSSQHAEWVYKHILKVYGCLLGTWVRDDYPFGGLLDVKFKDGRIVGSTWRPHPDLGRPLKKTGLFVVDVDDDGKAVVRCDMDRKCKHECAIEILAKDGGLVQFQTLCVRPSDHRTVSKSKFTWNKKAE